MTNHKTLVERAMRVAPDHEYLTWIAVLDAAFTGSVSFSTPQKMKNFCASNNILYAEALKAAVIERNGWAVLSVENLYKMEMDCSAYQLAAVCCSPIRGVGIDKVFPAVDDWGIEVRE